MWRSLSAIKALPTSSFLPGFSFAMFNMLAALAASEISFGVFNKKEPFARAVEVDSWRTHLSLFKTLALIALIVIAKMMTSSCINDLSDN
ncbi:hypothetical protein EON63_09445 [archaeon]|nr:MAG: hypothetical protein EON63_09445 [archaeon]